MTQRPPEKRLRIRRRDDVDPGLAKINPETAKLLQIDDRLEVIVAGRKKLDLKATLFEQVPINEVWANSDEMRVQGLADNSIATIRRSRQ